MVYRNFEELIGKVRSNPVRRRIAVAAAGDEHTLEAVLHARKEGIADPVLVGDEPAIRTILQKLGESVPNSDIYHEPDLAASSEKAVSLVKGGTADLLMKGKVDTPILLKAVVNKENGLGKDGLMSHFTIFEVPTYHKLLTVVDGGMVTYPTLEQKKAIIENTVDTLRSIGYTEVKIGALACVEKVNPRMPETVEARALQEMSERGEFAGCIVEGPVAYDCAVSREIADFKGYESRIAGDVDVLLAPNIHTGNIMGKLLLVTAKSRMAGFIVGARCPIVLTSRASSSDEKYLSIVTAVSASER